MSAFIFEECGVLVGGGVEQLPAFPPDDVIAECLGAVVHGGSHDLNQLEAGE